MSNRKITRISLRNFKCHNNMEQDLSDLTLLAGGNAVGKSSVIQGILLANTAWNNVERKRVYTNNVGGVYMGNPSTIISEEHDDEMVGLGIFINGKENIIELKLPSADFEDIYFDIENYEDIVEEHGKENVLNRVNIYYLNAERYGPRVISEINDTEKYYVGLHGENTDYVISKMDFEQKKNRNLEIPSDLQASKLKRFSANVEEWLNIIIPETKLKTSMDTELGIATIKFQNGGENFYLPTATGFGITYALPIITQALIASMLHDCVLLVENPEAHLHPFSQSKMGQFLAFVSTQGVQVIVETHSEHVINGARLQLGKLKKTENATILFFERNDGNQVLKNIKINQYGELDEWPKGFFDQEEKDLREILELRLCRK